MENGIKRDSEATEGPLAAHVKKLCDEVRKDLAHWRTTFKIIRQNRAFARGMQWDGMKEEDLADPDRAYVANITAQHLKQSTASIYARNPRFVWRRSKRLYNKLWDGTAQSLTSAMQSIAAGMDQSGVSAAIVEEAMRSKEEQTRLSRMGETLAIAYEKSLAEQSLPFKLMMKKVVMSGKTCGVGYVKQDFQRVMGRDPDTDRQLADARSQLDTINRIAQGLEDGVIQKDDAQAQQLQNVIDVLEKQEQILLREGLTLDYPDALNIIPDRELTFLPTFLGCRRVTEQYHMTPERVQEVYGVDLGKKYRPYRADQPAGSAQLTYSTTGEEASEGDMCCVWEVWDKVDGIVYTVCDGHDDYLAKGEPDPWTERFWPWFVFAPNWLDSPETPFPPGDVQAIESQQREINRAGESLRDHRWAARPGHVTGQQVSEEDTKRLAARRPHEVTRLAALADGQKIGDMLEPVPTNPIDPNLYSTGAAFQDVLRSVGRQQAQLGPTSGATATESSIAQSAMAQGDDSTIDELDDLLTEMARAGGQILLTNLTAETVMEMVGPGAVWPEMNREEAAKEIYLEVEAGSSGRKNQAQEVQVRTQLYPHMFQLPGLSQEWMIKDMLKVMDSRINYEDAVDMGALSVIAQNGAIQAQANNGSKGGANQPTPETGGQQGPQQPEPTPQV